MLVLLHVRDLAPFVSPYRASVHMDWNQGFVMLCAVAGRV